MTIITIIVIQLEHANIRSTDKPGDVSSSSKNIYKQGKIESIPSHHIRPSCVPIHDLSQPSQDPSTLPTFIGPIHPITQAPSAPIPAPKASNSMYSLSLPEEQCNILASECGVSSNNDKKTKSRNRNGKREREKIPRNWTGKHPSPR